MSGWCVHRLQFDLTPTKARYYFRRSDVKTVEEAFANAGLIARLRSWGGWSVHATVGQIWTALSGEPSRFDEFMHEGALELIQAGFFTESSYASSVGWGDDAELVCKHLWPSRR